MSMDTWKQLPETRSFVDHLKNEVESIKYELINSGHDSIDKIAITTIEIRREARVLENIITYLTTMEQ